MTNVKMFSISWGPKTAGPVSHEQGMALLAQWAPECAQHGAPKIVECAPAAAPPPAAVPPAAVPAPAPVAKPAPAPAPAPAPDLARYSGKADGRAAGSAGIDAAGLARSESDVRAALDGGFAVAPTVYERGSKLIAAGVENARKSRADHDAKPPVGEAMARLISEVRAEERADIITSTAALRLDTGGRLCVMPDRNAEKPEARVWLQRDAFKQITGRSQAFPNGAGAFLSDPLISADLRAVNFNRLAKAAPDGEAVVLRTRNARGGGRAVYAAVSERYAACDTDTIASVVADAMKDQPDARADVSYDGGRVRIEVSFHTTVAPENFVAGEFYRAGIVITSRDDGKGGLRGSSFLLQNLCLNLLIVDRAEQTVVEARHIGDRAKMVRDLRTGIRRAQETIAPFLKRWGYAQKVSATKDIPAGMLVEGASARTIFGGIFQGLWERELVPVSGRRADVEALAWRAVQADQSSEGLRQAGYLTRGGIVNSLTRIAHESFDSFEGGELEKAAASLVWADGPLPFVKQ